MTNHTGTETRSRLILASSGEYWTMNESLIQQYYVNEDGFLVVKFIIKEKKIDKTLKLVLSNTRASSRGNTGRASVIYHDLA